MKTHLLFYFSKLMQLRRSLSFWHTFSSCLVAGTFLQVGPHQIQTLNSTSLRVEAFFTSSCNINTICHCTLHEEKNKLHQDSSQHRHKRDGSQVFSLFSIFCMKFRSRYECENTVQISSSEMIFLASHVQRSFPSNFFLLTYQIWNFFLHSETSQQRHSRFSPFSHSSTSLKRKTH